MVGSEERRRGGLILGHRDEAKTDELAALGVVLAERERACSRRARANVLEGLVEGGVGGEGADEGVRDARAEPAGCRLRAAAAIVSLHV